MIYSMRIIQHEYYISNPNDAKNKRRAAEVYAYIELCIWSLDSKNIIQSSLVMKNIYIKTIISIFKLGKIRSKKK